MAVKRCTKHKDKECYLVDWRPEGRNGTHRQRHFEGTEAEALSYWMDMVRLARRTRHQGDDLDPKVCDIIATWKEVYANNHLPNTVKDLGHCLVPLMRHFGNLHLSELAAPIIVERYKSQRLQCKVVTHKRSPGNDSPRKKPTGEGDRTVSKRTIAKELSYLSSFLRWCHRNGYLQQPIRVDNYTPKQTAPKNPIRPLHREAVNDLVEAIEPQYRGILLAMTDAGLRISEALTLTVKQIDLRRRIIIIRGKGDKERFMVIASSRLHHELSHAIGEKKEGHLFVNPRTDKPYNSIKRALDRAAIKAGIDQHVYHHLMRHSFGTNAIVAGVSLKGVQDMLGHVSASTTQKYLHLAGVYFQEEAVKLGDYFDCPKKPDKPEKDNA
jgi:site-specific recombinase XerD